MSLEEMNKTEHTYHNVKKKMKRKDEKSNNKASRRRWRVTCLLDTWDAGKARQYGKG